MRILFYLPGVTAKWFDEVVVPLARVAATRAEVHVAAPPPWLGTGVGARELAALGNVVWHMLDDADHASLRTVPAAPERLIARIAKIDADYTFCRAADIVTPAAFPGSVRYLMEGDFPPAAPAGRILLTGPELYHHGVMPAWKRGARQIPTPPMEMDRAAYLAAAGLPAGRRIIAVPLEHDGPENFFTMHSVEPRNDRFIADLAARFGDDVVLALTVHPDPQRQAFLIAAAERIGALDPDKVRIVRGPGEGGAVTAMLARHCDGMIVRDSKAFAWAAVFGKPLLRLSRFPTAAWLNAYEDVDAFREAILSGHPRVADPRDLAAWIDCHNSERTFLPGETGFDELLARADDIAGPAPLSRHAGEPCHV